MENPPDWIKRPRWKLYTALTGGLFMLGVLYFALRLSLFTPPGKLIIQTDPSGAHLIIDQTAVRTAPVVDLVLSPGKHTINAQWDDFQSDTTITIFPGQSVLLVMKGIVSPDAQAKLTLVAIPDGEAAVDDGPFQAARESISLGVPAGTRKVKFRSSRGDTRERSVEMRGGEASTLRCYFEGVVQVDATLDFISAPAAITVDGIRRRESTPGSLTLLCGRHRISVSKEAYVCVPPEETLTVEPSFDAPGKYRVSFKLKREQ